MLHRVGGRSDCLPPRRVFVRKPLAFFIDDHAMTVGEVEMVMGHGCRPPAFRRLSHTWAVSSVLHPTQEKRPPHPLWVNSVSSEPAAGQSRWSILYRFQSQTSACLV